MFLDRFRSFIHFSSPWRWQAADRLNLVLCLSSLGMLAGLLLTLPLWTGARNFPEVPLLFSLPDFLTWALSLSLIGLCLLLPLSRNPRPPAIAILVILFILIAGDVNRLQPWIWMYAWILAGFVLYPTPPEGRSNDGPFLPILRIMLACVYLWSGIHKINPEFFNTVFPWMGQPLAQAVGAEGLWMGFAYLAPIAEIFIAISLFIPRLRGVGLIIAILSHIFILTMIGPFGHNWNSAVWPWNLVMIGLVWALFAPVIQDLWQSSRQSLKQVFAIFVIAFWLLAPTLNYFGAWDHYLSWSLYSGKITEARISGDRAAAQNFPPALQKVTIQMGERYTFFPSDWSITDMNAGVYPQAWVYQAIRDSLSRRLQQNLDIQIFELY